MNMGLSKFRTSFYVACYMCLSSGVYAEPLANIQKCYNSTGESVVLSDAHPICRLEAVGSRSRPAKVRPRKPSKTGEQDEGQEMTVVSCPLQDGVRAERFVINGATYVPNSPREEFVMQFVSINEDGRVVWNEQDVEADANHPSGVVTVAEVWNGNVLCVLPTHTDCNAVLTINAAAAAPPPPPAHQQRQGNLNISCR